MSTYNQDTMANQYYTNTTNGGGLGKSNYATLESAFSQSPIYPGSPFYGSAGPMGGGIPSKYVDYASSVIIDNDFGDSANATGNFVNDRQNASAYWGIYSPGTVNNSVTTTPFSRDYGKNNPPNIEIGSNQISTTQPGDPSSPFTPNVASPGEMAGGVNVDPANQTTIIQPTSYDGVNYPDQYGSDTLDTLGSRNPADVSDLIDNQRVYGTFAPDAGKSHNY